MLWFRVANLAGDLPGALRWAMGSRLMPSYGEGLVKRDEQGRLRITMQGPVCICSLALD